MPLATEALLPGVYFLPPDTSAGPGLPPLDVAAFVGFAQRGPLHLPVAIHDLEMYRAIFGGDLALAREPGGETVYAHLPQAVADFFANGGRRCYVVRVAGKTARRARLAVPHLAVLGPVGQPRLAAWSAAWEGAWADQLRLASRLHVTPLPSEAFRVDPAGLDLVWKHTGAPDALLSGDLLRLRLGDGSQWLFPVQSIARDPSVPGHTRLVGAGARPRIADPASSPWLGVDQVGLLGETGTVTLELDLVDLYPESGAICLELEGTAADQIQVGHLLRLDGAEGAFLFAVASRDRDRQPDSPESFRIKLTATELVGLQDRSLPDSSLTRVERLRFDLLLTLEGQRRPDLVGLAFGAGHPRFWGDVGFIESSMLFELEAPGSNGRQSGNGRSRTEAAARLFQLLREGRRSDRTLGELDPVPLAALLSPSPAGVDQVMLPIGMPTMLDEGDFAGLFASGHDGLDAFLPDLFLDDYLVPFALNPTARTSARTLRADAFDRYYLQDRQLRGLHSLMFVDEIALLSLPDAVHRPWEPGAAEIAAQPPPLLEPEGERDLCVLPETPFEPCKEAPSVADVQPDLGPLTGGTTVTILGANFTEEATVTFGGEPAGEVSPVDSATLRCLTPAGQIAGPVNVEVTTRYGSAELADAFTYQPASSQPTLPVVEEAAAYQDDALRALQQSFIYFCQARADVVGILTLPRHFEKRHCVPWLEGLRQQLGLPAQASSFDDARDLADLSYMAVYHPWLVMRSGEKANQNRLVPPDGAVCGMIAARERARQVWVAPANVALVDVLGLEPKILTEDWAELFELQFNLIRPEPRDFRAMSAHTLNGDRVLRQISARRLLILLRKVAMIRGVDFVFESNHERFRDSVRVALESLLYSLFEQGAFSGATPEESYWVRTDATVNTPQNVDQGRFIAEIGVAPSQPMEFITVALTRSGDGVLLATEA